MDIKYYWINIDKSIERRIFMEEQFKIRGIANQRISAITPETLETVIEDKPPYDCGSCCCIHNNHKDCILEYSCSCSHLKAIKEGYESGAPYFIVCEDDIYFPFEIDFSKMIEQLPKNFGICQLMVLDEGGNNYLYDECFKEKNLIFVKFEHSKRLFSTGFYLISRQGAKQLLDLCTNKETNKFDFRYIEGWKQADYILYCHINTYTLTLPFCFPILLFISEIHPNHYPFHKSAIEKILSIINEVQYNNPFITNHYDFDNFYNHYKELLTIKNNN